MPVLQDFVGGHIKGALNFPIDDFEDSCKVDELINVHLQGKDKVVVHCMFSQQRGPKGALKLARYLGERNRQDVSVHVLRGGFRRFVALYGANPQYCEGVNPYA
jgi:rhodanese-related sulfurtransferase